MGCSCRKAAASSSLAPPLRRAFHWCSKVPVPLQAAAAAEAAAPPALADVWEVGSPPGWGSVPAHHVHLPDGAGMPNSLSAPDLAVVASRQRQLTGRPSPSRSDDLALGYAGAGCQVRLLTGRGGSAGGTPQRILHSLGQVAGQCSSAITLALTGCCPGLLAAAIESRFHANSGCLAPEFAYKSPDQQLTLASIVLPTAARAASAVLG